MNNGCYIRGLLQEIGKKVETNDFKSLYQVFTYIICKMEEKYNLQEEEMIKQLELILESIK